MQDKSIPIKVDLVVDGKSIQGNVEIGITEGVGSLLEVLGLERELGLLSHHRHIFSEAGLGRIRWDYAQELLKVLNIDENCLDEKYQSECLGDNS